MQRYYREFFSKSKIQFLLLVATISLILAILNFDGMRTVLAFLAGAALYAIAEYVVHYGLLHKFPNVVPPLYQGHMKHHQYPNETQYLFGPMLYDIIIYTVYFIVMWSVFQNYSLGMAVIAGSSVYHLYYQWMHYIAHRPVKPITPWGRWMKKKHLLHHFKDEHSWYGVSHPVMDFLLGTHIPKSSKASRSTDISS
ncbi:MAG: fatty acid hydroxylase [Candidatus Carbobacillus altaicus]|uniref:Fatty acid hydroxylase n=1 Tax=Candidatus Carbonibacillus altaicus TaxID=2163959 RepID=A0A2R6Y0T9_9BACL|nr:MAG: fatty acid hydroxylase [Candidatus Carbobacillus altaicus]